MRLTRYMFVAHELVLDVPIWVARVRLTNLVRCGDLAGSAAAAYQDGQIRVGPFGGLPGASKLVNVQFLDPMQRDETTTLGMRWEATGAAGGLFPVLDADIRLAPAADERTRLSLAGSYRPPLGRLGHGLDRAILSRVATATIRELLLSVADALAEPADSGERTGSGERAGSPVIIPASGCANS
ncbi:MAG: hypothetical protein ACYCO9_11555 [Streptosporangiaceae bacterium]